MNRIRWFVLALIGSLALRPQENPDPLVQQQRAATAQAHRDYHQRLTTLADRYAGFVERQLAQAQAQGDLDAVLVLKNELEHVRAERRPAPGDSPAGLAQARQIFENQQRELLAARDAEIRRIDTQYVAALDARIQELTRAGDIPAAVALAEEKRKAEDRLKDGPAAPAASATVTPEPRLGPNLLEGGAFDEAQASLWRIVVPPGSRNRTEIFSEPNSNRNKALRIHQHASEPIYVFCGIRLAPGRTYEIRWRERLLRPWRTGVEMRGRGNYRMGFEIPAPAFEALPPADRAKLTRRVEFGMEPPADTNWRTQTRRLTAGPGMNLFLIIISPGEGEFLLDDIEVRELLSAP